MCLASPADLCISALTNPHMLSGKVSWRLCAARPAVPTTVRSLPANFAASVNEGAARCLSDVWKIFLNEKEDMTAPMNSEGEGYCR